VAAVPNGLSLTALRIINKHSNTYKCVESECSAAKDFIQHTPSNLGNPRSENFVTPVVTGPDSDASIATSETRPRRLKRTIARTTVIRLSVEF
jgi:hypothetical protein